MENNNGKYCIYCGKKISIDTKRCLHCGEWLGDDLVSTNHSSYNYAPQKNTADENGDLGYVPNPKFENNFPSPSNEYNNVNRNNRMAA